MSDLNKQKTGGRVSEMAPETPSIVVLTLEHSLGDAVEKLRSVYGRQWMKRLTAILADLYGR